MWLPRVYATNHISAYLSDKHCCYFPLARVTLAELRTFQCFAALQISSPNQYSLMIWSSQAIFLTTWQTEKTISTAANLSLLPHFVHVRRRSGQAGGLQLGILSVKSWLFWQIWYNGSGLWVRFQRGKLNYNQCKLKNHSVVDAEKYCTPDSIWGRDLSFRACQPSITAWFPGFRFGTKSDPENEI